MFSSALIFRAVRWGSLMDESALVGGGPRNKRDTLGLGRGLCHLEAEKLRTMTSKVCSGSWKVQVIG